MGARYLIDTNVLIDFCNGSLSEGGRAFLEGIAPEISIVTNIELFAARNISAAEFTMLKGIVNIALIHPVTTDLVATTIAIRQDYRLKLPDAMIAATAVVLDLTLVTRNVSDFSKVKGLQITNPHLG
jgi:predicted nucleic acid-binding protein